ncbi:MAG: glycosyltransferase family 4 protein [Draconibacterium sp.]
MKNTIIFYGAVPKEGEIPIGGGEVGNARTVEILREIYTLVFVRKYSLPDGSLKKLRSVFIVFFNYLYYLLILIKFKNKRNSIVHISGFYEKVIFHELILIKTAKLLRYKVVYELRGGGAIYYYKNYSNQYRKRFESALNSSDFIFSQGKENFPFINSITKKRIFHYPNYITSEFIPETNPSRQSEHIQLVYFGRLNRFKNIEIIINSLKELHNLNINAHLSLIGKFASEEYKQKIENLVYNLDLSNKITFYPACNHIQLKNHLKNKHFFIFPTVLPSEGHSNSLTEAMSHGIIPIVSANGFNASVVGDPKLVLKENTPEAITSIISMIIEEEKITELSNYCYKRIQDNFTKDIVLRKLKAEYDCLFDIINTNQALNKS